MADLHIVEIPDRYLELAGEWYDGQGDMMYALSSTGDLTLGSQRPRNDSDEPMTNQEWHVHLWDCLSVDVGRAARSARKSGHYDAQEIEEFETFCDETADSLRKQYEIED